MNTLSPRRRLAAAAVAVLAALSFLLYAAGVISLREDKRSTYDAENYECAPAAISHVVHGAPLGFMYRNICWVFFQAHAPGVRWHAVSPQAVGARAGGTPLPTILDSTGLRDAYRLTVPDVWKAVEPFVCADLGGAQYAGSQT